MVLTGYVLNLHTGAEQCTGGRGEAVISAHPGLVRESRRRLPRRPPPDAPKSEVRLYFTLVGFT